MHLGLQAAVAGGSGRNKRAQAAVRAPLRGSDSPRRHPRNRIWKALHPGTREGACLPLCPPGPGPRVVEGVPRAFHHVIDGVLSLSVSPEKGPLDRRCGQGLDRPLSPRSQVGGRMHPALAWLFVLICKHLRDTPGISLDFVGGPCYSWGPISSQYKRTEVACWG